MELLQNGVKDVFTSEKYLNYLTMLSKFHNYSYNNVLLISLQNPNATLVAGYNDWVKKHHRYVKKEKRALKSLPLPHIKKKFPFPYWTTTATKSLLMVNLLWKKKPFRLCRLEPLAYLMSAKLTENHYLSSYRN